MAKAAKATFGVPVAAAEPHVVVQEIFEDVCDRLRRAVQAAAKLGDREAGLDLVTLERDIQELSREFGGCLDTLTEEYASEAGVLDQEKWRDLARAVDALESVTAEVRDTLDAIDND